MQQAPRRKWLQFSLRSLMMTMFAVACFFAGRMSLQRELNRARAVELELLRAQEAALAAERAAQYQLLFAQAQASWATAAQNEAAAPSELPLPKNLVEETASPVNRSQQ